MALPCWQRAPPVRNDNNEGLSVTTTEENLRVTVKVTVPANTDWQPESASNLIRALLALFGRPGTAVFFRIATDGRGHMVVYHGGGPRANFEIIRDTVQAFYPQAEI